MSQGNEILNQLRALKAKLLANYPIARLALLGSYAREDQNDQSDIDILVEFIGKVGSRFIDLADELENALGKKVDLVSLGAVKPKYFSSIKNDLIYV